MDWETSKSRSIQNFLTTDYVQILNREKHELREKFPKMLLVVATLLQKMLHLSCLSYNDVADVAPFSTSHT
jgi:hypothetical protein